MAYVSVAGCKYECSSSVCVCVCVDYSVESLCGGACNGMLVLCRCERVNVIINKTDKLNR